MTIRERVVEIILYMGMGGLFLLSLFALTVHAQKAETDKEQVARTLGQLHASTASLNACQQSAGDLAVLIQRLETQLATMKAEAEKEKTPAMQDGRPREDKK